MIKSEQMKLIHQSFCNNKNKQAVEMINEYMLYDFFADYKSYLESIYMHNEYRYRYFTKAVIIYFRTTYR